MNTQMEPDTSNRIFFLPRYKRNSAWGKAPRAPQLMRRMSEDDSLTDSDEDATAASAAASPSAAGRQRLGPQQQQQQQQQQVPLPPVRIPHTLLPLRALPQRPLNAAPQTRSLTPSPLAPAFASSHAQFALCQPPPPPRARPPPTRSHSLRSFHSRRSFRLLSPITARRAPRRHPPMHPCHHPRTAESCAPADTDAGALGNTSAWTVRGP